MDKYINQQNFLLWALFIGGMIPRLHTIGSPLAGDEAVTFNHYAHLNFSEILFNYPDSNQHALFSILSNICLLVFGDHEVAFRLPSLLAGALAIPLNFYTCRSLEISQSISILSALLLALYVPHIAYSQEGRGYALTVFLALCLICCSIHILGNQRLWLWRILLVVSATSMVITLPSNVFFVAGAAGFCWILRKFMKSENSVFVNFYCESEAKININKNEIFIQQKTSYPESGKIELTINPKIESDFEVLLRIPIWSENTGLKVNGEVIKNIKPGKYISVQRTWKTGDKIELTLDLRGKLVQQNNYQAIVRGPIVLARDTRFGDGFVDETAEIKAENGFVNLSPADNKPENIWMSFTAPLVLGTDLEGEFRNPKRINFCDFGSAGNTWEQTSRYRVWIPQTLNAMKINYKKY